VASAGAPGSRTPERAWSWLEAGRNLVPAAADDRVTWSYPSMEPWHLAYTTALCPTEIVIDGRVVWRDGVPTLVDPAEVRAKAAEQAQRLFARL